MSCSATINISLPLTTGTESKLSVYLNENNKLSIQDFYDARYTFFIDLTKNKIWKKFIDNVISHANGKFRMNGIKISQFRISDHTIVNCEITDYSLWKDKLRFINKVNIFDITKLKEDYCECVQIIPTIIHRYVNSDSLILDKSSYLDVKTAKTQVPEKYFHCVSKHTSSVRYLLYIDHMVASVFFDYAHRKIMFNEDVAILVADKNKPKKGTDNPFDRYKLEVVDRQELKDTKKYLYNMLYSDYARFMFKELLDEWEKYYVPYAPAKAVMKRVVCKEQKGDGPCVDDYLMRSYI